MVFVISFMTRGLQDSDLISQQTNARLSNGAGIFKNFGKTDAELQKLVESDNTLNYALNITCSPSDATKEKKDDTYLASMAEIEKKHITEWQLFKSGLFVPQMDNKSSYDCVLEGLRLISDSLYRRSDCKLESLQTVEEKADKKKASDQDEAKLRSSLLI